MGFSDHIKEILPGVLPYALRIPPNVLSSLTYLHALVITLRMVLKTLVPSIYSIRKEKQALKGTVSLDKQPRFLRINIGSRG